MKDMNLSVKLEDIKNHINQDNIKKFSDIMKEDSDIRRFGNYMIHKSKNNESFTDEEYNDLYLLIDILQTLYNYSGYETGFSDEEYDILYEILTNHDIERVTTPVLSDNVVHHTYTSLRGTLEKIYGLRDDDALANKSRKTLSDWVNAKEKIYYNKTGKHINLWNEEVYVFPKWDGVSIIFEFDENNKLKRALTRGHTDTNEAQNVGFIFSTLQSSIKEKGMKTAYGLKTEVMMKEYDLETYNLEYNENYKTTRSIVSSIINSDEIDGREQLLEIIKLRTETLNKNGDENLQELSNGVYDRPHIRCRLKDVDLIEEFAVNHKYVDGLRCDGAVIYIINPEVQRILGRENHKNLYEVAYKFNEEVTYTKIKDIEFQMGLFRRLTPVAILEPVKMKGNTIEKVSLGSIARFNSLNLGKGDTVKVLYEIIPYLIYDKNDPRCKRSDKKRFKVPKNCPDCGYPLEYSEDMAIIQCNNKVCDSYKKGKIINYLNKLHSKGISYAIVDTLYNLGYLKTIDDLYKLGKHKKDLEQIPGFGEISIRNILTEIDRLRILDDCDLLSAIGIEGISTKKFEKIFEKYSFDELLEFSDNYMISPLLQIEGIKEKTAKKIILGLRENKKLINKLSKLIVINHRIIKDIKFKACFTKIRSEILSKTIESLGGKVVDNVTKDTDILIVPSIGTESNSVTKAKKYGIEIIPIDEVEKYLERYK